MIKTISSTHIWRKKKKKIPINTKSDVLFSSILKLHLLKQSAVLQNALYRINGAGTVFAIRGGLL